VAARSGNGELAGASGLVASAAIRVARNSAQTRLIELAEASFSKVGPSALGICHAFCSHGLAWSNGMSVPRNFIASAMPVPPPQ